VTFALSPRYGLLTAREAHDWFLGMMRVHEEFEVETAESGEPPLSFWTETVRRVVVESTRLETSVLLKCESEAQRGRVRAFFHDR